MKTEKLKSVSPVSADVDIELINQYAEKELTPEEVFCFSMILCDNEVDRDMERFTDESLDELAPLFLGKSVLFDHRWSTEKQVARLYRTFVEKTDEKTLMGDQKNLLRGSAYMLRTDETKELIKSIEGGIKKEVSVGCQMGGCKCSICGDNLSFDWQTGKTLCKNGHLTGETYDGKLCVGDLTDPKDAYEVSFVAVPAQRGAGVTKGEDGDKIEFLKTIDLNKISKEKKIEAVKILQTSIIEDDERNERARILAENKKFMEEK